MKVFKPFLLLTIGMLSLFTTILSQRTQPSGKETSELIISPSPVYFGAIPLGSSALRDVIIYNISSDNITISSIEIDGDQSSDFVIENQIGSSPLGPLEQLILQIRYTPSAIGQSKANLIIASNAGTDTDSLIATGTQTQNGVITFERIIGGTESDVANSIAITNDGGYAILGETIPDPDVDFPDVYLVKTDAYGAVQWTRNYGGDESEAGYAIQTTLDNGFIIAGYTESFGAGSSDGYIIKVNEQGEIQWSKTFGSSQNDKFYDIVVTNDGGYLAAGSTVLTDGYNREAYLVKINSNGDEEWSHSYGYNEGGEIAFGITQTRDGGYVFVGSTTSLGSGGFDVYLVKIDESGNEQWHKVYGGSEWEEGFSVQETEDGGFILTGYTVSEGAGARDVYLVKTDIDGNLQWYRTFGYINSDVGFSVKQDPNGGFLIAASTITEITQQNQYSDAYIIKTDPSGIIIWSKLLGGDKSESFADVQLTYDGIIFAGTTDSYSKNNDMYVVKTNFDGIITKIFAPINGNILSSFLLKQNFPNPFNDETIIEYYLQNPANITLSLFDILGRQVQTLYSGYQSAGLHRVKLNANDLSSGIYFYQLSNGSQKLVQKMVLIR